MRSTALKRCGAMVAAALCFGGCKSWEPVAASPREVISAQRPDAVRVTDQDGDEITIQRPIVRNDSIVTSERDVLGNPLGTPGVPYADVNTIEVEQFSPVKTGVFAAVLVGIAVAWTQALNDSSGGNPDPEPGPPKGSLTISPATVIEAISRLIR